MNKKVEVIFSKDAQKVYDKLKENAHQNKVDRMLFDAIEKKLDIIRSNIFYGDIIPKSLIPREYRLKYNLTSLLKVELPCFWRLLYTLNEDKAEIIIIAFIIEILDHKKYNKRFGYKKH
ncbi:hypothetical protein JW756_02605 [Candidatus Woesearchaeota archaeon]|nr:hypothetical protein [Candidatus Woesearchaeota archaeon]